MSLPSLLSLMAQQVPGAPGEDLYDIVVLTPKEPIWPFLLWSGLTLLFFIILGWVIWYFLRRQPSHQPKENPQSKAIRRFRRLKQNGQELEANQFTLEVSDILKNYLADKYTDPVRFETTPEFLNRIAEKKTQLPNAAQQELRGFLIASDEVKFANKPDAGAQVAPLLKRAENVVNLCETIGNDAGTGSS